jgi:aryl-alcohol dehydrogenase (NADP+)
LTGKYMPDASPPEGSRAARNDQRMMQTEWRPESLAIAQQLKARAEALGMTASQFAVAWMLGNRLVTSVICGPRTEAQLEDYIAALDHRLPPDCEALVDGLVVPGHSSTPGYRDPMEPTEGRLAAAS